MEFHNQFHVPSDIDTTFETLTDLAAVAPCLPGATLEEVDGSTYTGRVKVKVGPIQVTYHGTAELTEVDREAKRGRIEASGKETRGSGTANADVTATLSEDEHGTRVDVHTDLHVTGKPAQFGRGVMADVGEKLITSFAERLRERMSEDVEVAGADDGAAAATPTDDAATTAGGAGAVDRAVTGPDAPEPGRRGGDGQRQDDALDLVEFAGAATAKRVLPLVGAVAAVLALIWWWRSR